MLKRLLQNVFRRPRSAAPRAFEPEPEPSPGFVAPRFRLFNKMYREPPYDDPARRAALVGTLDAVAAQLMPNRPASHAFLADDMLAWSRVLGFLREPRFVDACAPYAQSAIIGARIWRVYTLCWAALHCRALPGDYADIGCYDGATVEIMARYADFATAGKTWYLYDAFDDPPDESRKQAHGPELRSRVEARVAALGRFRVIQGLVPQSFEQGLPERIAFAQIDLNAAEPELACLERIYDRIVPGGILVLDDYGFARYRGSHDAEHRFFAARGDSVLELPTGQGLFIKRA